MAKLSLRQVNKHLSVDELESLQSVIITNHRFICPGYRIEGGFIENYDRTTGVRMPGFGWNLRFRKIPAIVAKNEF